MTNNPKDLTIRIKAEAHSLGFFACGAAKACPVDPLTADSYRKWIDAHGYATMDYMAANIEKRLDPTLLVEGVRSIVCVALGYAPATRIADNEYQIAAYAYGKDYHDIMKQKLHQLAANCNITDYRAFCDTAPVLERYWAQKAGLGWIGRNRHLIIPNAGTMFFLGELFITEELIYDAPLQNRCGNCNACIKACPTHALLLRKSESESQQTFFDSDKCLSYQTIENRGDLSKEAIENMGNYIYGCDRCQTACPWNRFAKPTTEPQLQPSTNLLAMHRDDWHNLSPDQYRTLFKGSAVKRAKYEGLMRNINSHDKKQ